MLDILKPQNTIIESLIHCRHVIGSSHVIGVCMRKQTKSANGHKSVPDYVSSTEIQLPPVLSS